MNDDDAVWLEEAAKILTVADEKLGWNRFVTHEGTSSNRPRLGNPDFRFSGEKALYPFGNLYGWAMGLRLNGLEITPDPTSDG
jgi:hypothetical protein